MARPTKNNAEYFSHDCDMRNDVRIKALRRKFSHTGYAVWSYLLETLTDSDFFEVEWEEINIELLAADYDVTVEDLHSIVGYCLKIGLLQMQDDKLLSEAHQLRLKAVIDNREQQRANGKLGGNPNFKKGQTNPYYKPEETLPEDNPKITDPYVSPEETLPEDNQSKEKESKVKEIKEEIIKKETKEKVPPKKEDNMPVFSKSETERPYSLSPYAPKKTLGVDENLKICQESEQWLDSVCLTLVKSREEVLAELHRFPSHLSAIGATFEKTEQDFKQHFYNYLRKKDHGNNSTKQPKSNIYTEYRKRNGLRTD